MFKKLRDLDLTSRVILLATGILLGAFFIQQGRAAQASCVMPTSGTVSGLTLVNDINACNGSILSLYSGGSAPGAPTTGMLWFNTSTNFIQQYDGASWLNIWFVDAANHLTTPPIGGGIPTASINSAGTTDLGSVPQSFKTINGTTTITSFGSSATPGTIHVLKFGGILTLTYNATGLILPGSQNITTAAGDVAFALYLGSSNWQVLSFSPISGAAVSNPAVPLGTVFYGDFMTLPAKTAYGRGQAIARSSFPQYLAAVTRAQSMTRTSGNATLAGVADTSGMGPGMPVEGSGIATGCTIVSLVANTSITLNNSTCVTASGSATITVFGTGYGAGGDQTTVGVKDCQGRAIAGIDNGTGRLTSPFFGAGFNALNGTGGAESLALSIPQLPVVTPAGTIVSTTQLGGISTVSYGPVQSTGGVLAYGPSLSSGFNNLTTSSAFTGTPFGSGNAHRTVQPTVLANCVVQVLP